MRSLTEHDSIWTRHYSDFFGIPSEIKEAFELSRTRARLLGKEGICLSLVELQLLSFFVRLFACKNFMEIGTLTGSSALWAAQSMGEGDLYTLEREPLHVEAARDVFSAYHGRTRIHLAVGEAEEKLEELRSHGPFDGIFIDGDKAGYGHYLDWAEENLSPGALILADNVFRQSEAMRAFNHRLANRSKFDSIILPTQEGLFVGRFQP